MFQTTLILIKPDAYTRGLSGLILARFEQRGLTIEDLRVSRGQNDLLEAHYGDDPLWLQHLGTTTLADYAAAGRDVTQDLGIDDPAQIGRIVRERLIAYMLCAPLIAAALSGNRAIEAVRAMIGPTLPITALAGTIRGDYALDSADHATSEQRAVRNLVHASATPAEAIRELALWFPGRDHTTETQH